VGQREHSKSRGLNIFFSMEKETKIINWEQDFVYTTQ
jgi:hypothetical protein